MKPRIIWLDDDIHKEKLIPTVGRFKRRFDIIECETIDEFYQKSSAYKWDAAILDVVNAKDENTDIFPAILHIATSFPDRLWFIFSGKDRITKKENDIKKSLEKGSFVRSYVTKDIYVKDEDEELLITDINTAVINLEIWQVENQYEPALKVADTLLTDKDCRKHLLDILSAAAGVSTIDSHLYYNKIRVILEWMFRAARKQGLLHEKCFDSKDHINLTDASLYMAGKPTLHSGVMCKKAHFPVLLADNVRFILEVTGGASHTTEVDERDNPNLTAYWESIQTPYLLYSLAFMLCDVLIWFGQYVEENPDVLSNKALGRDLILKGTVEKDKDGDYFVGSCYIPKYKLQFCRPGFTAEVTEFEESDAEHKDKYPITVRYFKDRRI